MFPNTRPINITPQVDERYVNNRGRVYRCRRCDSNPHEGERTRVIQQLYRKHIALDRVPFYCSICKFVSTSQAELERHTQSSVYAPHKATVDAMIKNGETVNERDSLLQNMQHYIPTDKDLLCLSKEESDSIYMSKQKPKPDIVKRAMEQSGIESSNSDRTKYIIDQMLDEHNLSPFSLGKSLKPAYFAPVKSQNDKAPSTISSGSSSSSSSASTVSHQCQCNKELEE